MKTILITIVLVVVYSYAKSTARTTESHAPKAEVEFQDCSTDKGSYERGETVKLSCIISNSGKKTLNLKEVKVKIKNISKNSSFFTETSLPEHITIDASKTHTLSNVSIWAVPNDASTDAYGVYLVYPDDNGKEKVLYQTFFRVVKDGILTVYNITENIYKGLNVYALDGGMSAEYIVEKSIESLSGGISHSWFVNGPGSGPNPVYATPQFLQRSVIKTVDSYNRFLGENTKFETVILSTGFPAIPNISNVLKAPVLPLHFLVTANNIKEIETILKYSNKNGYPSYSTLGYDLSVPDAVAWVKLLDLPKEYVTFLKQHHVKNIVIMGSTGIIGGENAAKQVLDHVNGKFEPGSIYILYPRNGVEDVPILKQKINDFPEFTLQTDYTNISDWESGVIENQIKNIAGNKHISGITRYSITSPDLLDMYNLGTPSTLAYFKKNNLTPRGVAINPYLLSHPAYEISKGYIPLHYWQLNPPQNTVDRLKTMVNKAVADYYPALKFAELNMWVNSSNNFGAAAAAGNLINSLKANGFSNIKENDYSKDEIWNPNDGLQAPNELIVNELVNEGTLSKFKSEVKTLRPLTLNEFIQVAQKFPTITISKMN
jgi:hypothetical protein